MLSGCVSSDCFAIAILLAVKGGPLVPRARPSNVAYAGFPHLRLFQYLMAIFCNDLAMDDIVQNASGVAA